MPLIISDTNIFIDLDTAGLTVNFFALPETFAVPDVLYIEELSEYHPELPGYGLQVMELPPDSVALAVELAIKYKDNSPGYNDLLALVLAKQEDAPLLTGDWQLRKTAELEDIDVRGTLWVIEALVTHRIINIDRARAAYDAMKEKGRRLPWDIVEEQIKSLESK